GGAAHALARLQHGHQPHCEGALCVTSPKSSGNGSVGCRSETSARMKLPPSWPINSRTLTKRRSPGEWPNRWRWREPSSSSATGRNYATKLCLPSEVKLCCGHIRRLCLDPCPGPRSPSSQPFV